MRAVGPSATTLETEPQVQHAPWGSMPFGALQAAAPLVVGRNARRSAAGSFTQAVARLPNARHVSDIGHWGTGDLEIALSTLSNLDTAKPLIAAAYEGRVAQTAAA